ncbi:MAG: YkgJ family cysteine cluster protein [Chloroflexia bacterium]
MEIERPRLRPDLEIFPGRPGEGVLLYDPARRSLFELEPEARPLLDLLDGSRTPQEIARFLHRRLDDVLELLDDLADWMLLVDPEQEELLAAWKRAYEAEDLLLQPILDGRPPPPITPDRIAVVDEAHHTCLRCGACCHYAVPVSPEERHLLEAFPWPEDVVPPEAGRLFLPRPGTQWGRLEETIATRSHPTRCAFLDAEMRCRVHQELGPQAKPFPCRLFPLAYPVLVTGRAIFSLTFECPNLWRTYDTGEPLSSRREELAALASEMEEIYALPERIPLDEEQEADRAEYLAWERSLLASPWTLAGDPRSSLERLRQGWRRLVPSGPDPIPGPEGLARMAGHLGKSAREHREVLADSPEGEDGVDRAVQVLERLAGRPETAWDAFPGSDSPAANLFLERFLRHFVEGKQMLLYRPLSRGMRALALLLLLARGDAGTMAREEGLEVSPALLNRALARWERLLEIRPFRLAFLREVF